MIAKKRIWLAQVNSLFGRSCFLPYSCGILQAYAQSIPEIREAYDFCGFAFIREPIEDVVRRMGRVDVFGGSVYCWNAAYTLALAKAVKEANPGCLVVLGGPHVPNKSEGYFVKHPFADVLVHGEGEETFAELLLGRIGLHGPVDGISFKGCSSSTVKTNPRPRKDNLDELPSPYLTGVFDELMRQPYEFHASQETHRGCPFPARCATGDRPSSRRSRSLVTKDSSRNSSGLPICG